MQRSRTVSQTELTNINTHDNNRANKNKVEAFIEENRYIDAVNELMDTARSYMEDLLVHEYMYYQANYHKDNISASSPELNRSSLNHPVLYPELQGKEILNIRSKMNMGSKPSSKEEKIIEPLNKIASNTKNLDSDKKVEVEGQSLVSREGITLLRHIEASLHALDALLKDADTDSRVSFNMKSFIADHILDGVLKIEHEFITTINSGLYKNTDQSNGNRAIENYIKEKNPLLFRYFFGHEKFLFGKMTSLAYSYRFQKMKSLFKHNKSSLKQMEDVQNKIIELNKSRTFHQALSSHLREATHHVGDLYVKCTDANQTVEESEESLIAKRFLSVNQRATIMQDIHTLRKTLQQTNEASSCSEQIHMNIALNKELSNLSILLIKTKSALIAGSGFALHFGTSVCPIAFASYSIYTHSLHGYQSATAVCIAISVSIITRELANYIANYTLDADIQSNYSDIFAINGPSPKDLISGTVTETASKMNKILNIALGTSSSVFSIIYQRQLNGDNINILEHKNSINNRYGPVYRTPETANILTLVRKLGKHYTNIRIDRENQPRLIKEPKYNMQRSSSNDISQNIVNASIVFGR